MPNEIFVSSYVTSRFGYKQWEKVQVWLFVIWTDISDLFSMNDKEMSVSSVSETQTQNSIFAFAKICTRL